MRLHPHQRAQAAAGEHTCADCAAQQPDKPPPRNSLCSGICSPPAPDRPHRSAIPTSNHNASQDKNAPDDRDHAGYFFQNQPGQDAGAYRFPKDGKGHISGR